ncbi:MAG: isoleucine--tRNA ligase [Bacteroidia bacterium]|nr:isoleucine--tRNA ligase [Bacteroidia bacterium]
MGQFPEYKSLNLPGIAESVLQRWQERRIFERSVEEREGRPSFTFYEGPPSANGLPGIHHVMSRSIKDIFCRYKTQKGFQVKRKGGWDTHGLPIEISVEKTLGITKEDIGDKISIEDYNKACRREVMKYKSVWDDLTRKMGYWVDLEHPYITFENSYIETCWYLLKELHRKNLLYKGYTIQPFSPAAGTGLSSHELNQPGTYKLVKDTTVVAQFKAIRDARSEKLFSATDAPVYFLAWTTTPWTLPSNAALAVGAQISYVLVRTFNPYTFEPVSVVLAKDLLGKYFSVKNAELPLEEYQPGNKIIPFLVELEFGGEALQDMRFEQLLPYVQPAGDAFRVITGDFVSTEDGTGIVHIAPTFGADDFRVARQHGIPAILVEDENGKPMPLVDRRGRFVKEVSDFPLEYVKEEYLSESEKEAARQAQGRDKYLSVDERIAIRLKQENRAFKVEKYEHSYPHCWRTDKPILYYPLDSWFIRTTACKERMIELNKTINWKPESTGTGRFGNWLENLVDWNLSRSRYWGIPLPIWRSEDGEEKCIGSVEELYTELKQSVAAGLMSATALEHLDPTKADFDLHRPYVDHAVLVSSSGKAMYREPDLIDVWFDSGAMPYAQWNYPFSRNSLDQVFPADFIAEGVDQTRGWFFTLHAIAVMLFDSVAFKNVVSNGLVLDKNGNKMSKRLGNAADPFTTLDTYGADATRWYMISNAQPWDNLKFNLEGIGEVQRKFFGTLYNTYNFFALYANIDGFAYEDSDIPVRERSELDRWILSLLNSLVKEVDACYAEYEPTRAARVIQDFVTEHLSNWYVRLSRRRFWKGEYSDDKKAAYQTLYTCLDTIARLMAPIAPFFADHLYADLNGNSHKDPNESVHLAAFPVADESLIDRELEERMQLAQDISSMTLSLRKKVNIKVRQPLQKILLPVTDPRFRTRVMSVEELIRAEVNVEEIQFLEGEANILVKKLKPNFKALGPKVGGLMKQLTVRISEITQEEIAYLEQNGLLPLRLGEVLFDLLLEDVEILSEDIPGWQVASQGRLTVALDVTLSDELRDKGLARELVNRIQNIRKDKGFEVTDRILVRIKGPEAIQRSVKNNFDYIRSEILATQLEVVDQLDGQDIISVDVGEELQVLTSVNKYPNGH